MEIKMSEIIEAEIISMIKKGKIFIYPTDTVYGIGCDATNKNAVERIRRLKGTNHPFSVIAPSKDWIKSNLEVKQSAFLDKLPGPYTLIFRIKNSKCVAETVSSNGMLGCRIPDHPLTKTIQKSGRPFVTTSANVSGQKVIRKVSDFSDISETVDVIIDDGTLKGKGSTVIDLSKKVPILLRK